MVDTPRGHQLFPQFGSELTPSVSGYRVGYAEGADPAMGKCVHHCFCRDIPEWYSSGPASESVYHGQEVFEPRRFWHHGYIRMYVGKSAVRYDKFVDWWDDVASDLGALTMEAFFCPF